MRHFLPVPFQTPHFRDVTVVIFSDMTQLLQSYTGLDAALSTGWSVLTTHEVSFTWKISDIPDTDDDDVFFCQLFVYIHFIISLKTLLIDSLTFTDSSVNSWLTNCEISPVRQNIWPTFTLEALYGSPTGPCIHTFYVLRFPEITGWFSLDLEITKLCFPEITI